VARARFVRQDGSGPEGFGLLASPFLEISQRFNTAGMLLWKCITSVAGFVANSRTGGRGLIRCYRRMNRG